MLNLITVKAFEFEAPEDFMFMFSAKAAQFEGFTPFFLLGWYRAFLSI